MVGAALTALQKPDGGGLRPVAAGETLRRCVAKALWSVAKEEVQGCVEPGQLGVGTSMGTEIIVHRVRSCMGQNKGK